MNNTSWWTLHQLNMKHNCRSWKNIQIIEYEQQQCVQGEQQQLVNTVSLEYEKQQMVDNGQQLVDFA